jgi:N-acyl-D-amino-acid deacylase
VVNATGRLIRNLTLVLVVTGLALLVAPEVLSPTPGQGKDPPAYDLLLGGGTVVDGTGRPGFRADVALVGDRIARVAPEGIPAESARQVLDARGLIVAPGFVDHHAHIQTGILERPLLENLLRQGITTVLASLHSHDQPWPLDEHMAAVRSALNVGFFAGHNWTRRRVMGTADRPPTPEDLDRMRALVAESMCHGALGLSTGLFYVPGNYAQTDEVVELARVAAAHGGIYVSHMRDEFRGVLDSVEEFIRIAGEAEIPAQINHLKAAGAGQWGLAPRILAMVDSARAQGLDVKQDVYTYTASSTGSSVLFPQWALAGGRDSLAVRLQDPEIRARVEAGMREILEKDRVGDDLARIQFRNVAGAPDYAGRTLADLARDRGMPPTIDTALELVQELELAGGFSAIYHVMDEEDLEAFLRHPYTMIETDGDPVAFGQGFPHPRSYGSFPRLIHRYVNERGVLTLEEAIRRMTSLSMEQVGQVDRGVIEEGRLADLVAFHPAEFRDRATFQDPHRYAVGMIHVVVNGVPVIREASLTGERPGRVLHGPARPDAVTGGCP